MLEEFRPITPIRTIATKTLKHVSEVDTTKKVLKEVETTKKVLKMDEQECHTPTSSRGQSSHFLVCPPAPKKARVTLSNKNLASPSQVFFQVPHDLASIFVFRKPNIARRSEIYSS